MRVRRVFPRFADTDGDLCWCCSSPGSSQILPTSQLDSTPRVNQCRDRSARRPIRPITTDVDPATACRFPELANPVHAVVVFPERHKFRDEDRVADGARGRDTVFRVIGARSHLQQAADGLDPERATFDDVVPIRVDDRDYFRCWQSSAAPCGCAI